MWSPQSNPEAGPSTPCPSQASPNLILEPLPLASPENWGCPAWASSAASTGSLGFLWVFACPSFLSQAAWLCQGSPSPWVWDFALQSPSPMALPLFSALAPGRPSLASQLCSPLPVPHLASFTPSCLSTNGPPQRGLSPGTLRPPYVWPSERSQPLHKPVSPLWGRQPPCVLFLAGVGLYIFDYWNLIWIWSNSSLVINIHQIQLFKNVI